MSKHKPTPAPLWIRLAQNWGVQIGALFLAVVALTYYDSTPKTKSRKKERDATYLLSKPVKNQRLSKVSEQRGSVPPPPMEKGSKKTPVLPPPLKSQAATPAALGQTQASVPNLSSQDSVSSKVTLTNSREKTEALSNGQPKETAQSPIKSLRPLQLKMDVFFYFVPKSAIDGLVSQGESVTEGLVKLPGALFARELKTNRAQWRKVKSKSTSYELDKALSLSIATDADDYESSPLGFFLEAEISTDSPRPRFIDGTLNLNRRLSFGSDLSSVFSGTFSLSRSPREILVATGFASRQKELSELETSFYETDSLLKYIVEPQFSDDFSDLVLVLQFK